ncbi:MAG TPA: hypothetical protein VJV78_14690, partial [Polyangiales bacterium]|nr:hypothetical protein [Polyangiales bacterium]
MNFDADDSLDLLEGRHGATLAWQPIDPFDAPGTQDAVFDVETSGTCNADFECGYPYTAVQLTLELPKLDRKLDFEGTAYLRNARAEVVVRSSRSAADRLADPQAAVRGTGGERRYELHATFRRDRVVGELRVID